MQADDYISQIEDMSGIISKEQFNRNMKQRKEDRFDGDGEYRYSNKIKAKQKYKREKYKA